MAKVYFPTKDDMESAIAQASYQDIEKATEVHIGNSIPLSLYRDVWVNTGNLAKVSSLSAGDVIDIPTGTISDGYKWICVPNPYDSSQWEGHPFRNCKALLSLYCINYTLTAAQLEDKAGAIDRIIGTNPIFSTAAMDAYVGNYVATPSDYTTRWATALATGYATIGATAAVTQSARWTSSSSTAAANFLITEDGEGDNVTYYNTSGTKTSQTPTTALMNTIYIRPVIMVSKDAYLASLTGAAITSPIEAKVKVAGQWIKVGGTDMKPVVIQTTAPSDTNAVWIDTDDDTVEGFIDGNNTAF